MKIRLSIVLFLIFPNFCLSKSQEIASCKINVEREVLDGAPPGIVINGLDPEFEIRVHLLRCIEKWENSAGQWARVPVALHSWADYVTDSEGVVALDVATPVKSIHPSADALSLLRNGMPEAETALNGIRRDDLKIPLEASNVVSVFVEAQGSILATAKFELVQSLIELSTQVVAIDGLHGVFARPEKPGNYPVIISLHGSEGGSVEKAKARAAQFASRGYACLAINYFARDYEAIEGLRTEHVEVPIEMLVLARDWLQNQESVSIKKIGLYGISKGAEFALIAGTKYDWISAIVAVVPSDVVWEGYRDSGGKGARTSSWSFNKQPLPFVPLFDFDPLDKGVYRTNTERYSRSRRFYESEGEGARIKIEEIRGRVLLLASDRDEIWASGDMTRNMVERLAAGGRPDVARAIIYPHAGHQISGTGTFPVFLYGTQSQNPDSKDIVLEGNASADAMSTTLEFFEKELGGQQPAAMDSQNRTKR